MILNTTQHNTPPRHREISSNLIKPHPDGGQVDLAHEASADCHRSSVNHGCQTPSTKVKVRFKQIAAVCNAMGGMVMETEGAQRVLQHTDEWGNHVKVNKGGRRWR